MRDVERRANVARNCSGRSDVGGGWNRFTVAGLGGSGAGLMLASGLFWRLFGGVVFWGLSEGEEGGGANGARVSERGIRGNEAVEKM